MMYDDFGADERFLLTPIPHKFWWIVMRAIQHQIAHESTLIQADDTPDDVLDELDYGNDTMILKSVMDEFNNKNQRVIGDLYVLSQSPTQKYTLQPFGKPMLKDETVLLIFVAKDIHQAIAIKNQFLGRGDVSFGS